MARRTHLTEMGCISCGELEELGAGEREGWLADPSLLAALNPHALALAHAARSLVLVFTWDPGRRPGSAASLHPPVKIRPSLSPDDGKITAIEWLALGDLLALAVGTSAGHLLVYSPTADLIHKQIVHPGRVHRLRFRETKSSFQQDTASEELCVVMPGVIARFNGSEIQSLLRRWFQEAGSRMWDQKGLGDEDSFSRMSFQLWNVSKYGPCADAEIVGLMPPPLLELQLLLLLGSRASVTIVQLLSERMLSYQLIDCQRTGAGP